MKKLILLTMFLFGILVNAQVHFGAKVGVNRSNLRGIHGTSDPRYGFAAGAFAQISLDSWGNQFYVQPEVNYSQQGEKNQGKNIDEIYKLDYITIPVLFRAYFSERDDEFFGEIGPQMGFLISDKVELLNNATSSENPNEKYNSTDFGATVGIGYSIGRKFEINGRYYIGFSDVVENDLDDASNWTSNFQASLAYIF